MMQIRCKVDDFWYIKKDEIVKVIEEDCNFYFVKTQGGKICCYPKDENILEIVEEDNSIKERFKKNETNFKNSLEEAINNMEGN